MERTSMSVVEMGRLLGLRRTEAYFLVHKEQFEVRLAAGKMRVMIKSFEKWYANQLHYKKVSGEKPGAELLDKVMTVSTMANLLGISGVAAYELTRKLHFKSFKSEYCGRRLLIDRESFRKWLESQTRYTAIEEKEGQNV